LSHLHQLSLHYAPPREDRDEFELVEHFDETLLEATATYEDCAVYAWRSKALLVFIPDQECGRPPIGKVWVPLSAIDRESEVPFQTDFGYLIVKRWLAEKAGWV
jgi:hypothetical protein